VRLTARFRGAANSDFIDILVALPSCALIGGAFLARRRTLVSISRLGFYFHDAPLLCVLSGVGFTNRDGPRARSNPRLEYNFAPSYPSGCSDRESRMVNKVHGDGQCGDVRHLPSV
jgi:hypothetical protein